MIFYLTVLKVKELLILIIKRKSLNLFLRAAIGEIFPKMLQKSMAFLSLGHCMHKCHLVLLLQVQVKNLIWMKLNALKYLVNFKESYIDGMK